jgi:hypothetical protein
MAAWQLELEVLPLSAVRRVYGGTTPLVISEDDLYDHLWWEGIDIRNKLRAKLKAQLPALPQWSSKVESWGEDRGHRFEIICAKGGIEEMNIRVDVRTPDSAFVSFVGNLIREYEWGLRDPNGTFVCTKASLLFSIHQSDAFQAFDPPAARADGRS